MIFSVVSSAQEWLNVKWDDFKREEDNRAALKLKELEDAEQVNSAKPLISNMHVTLINDFFYRKNLKVHVLLWKRSSHGAMNSNWMSASRKNAKSKRQTVNLPAVSCSCATPRSTIRI